MSSVIQLHTRKILALSLLLEARELIVSGSQLLPSNEELWLLKFTIKGLHVYCVVKTSTVHTELF